MGAMSKASFVTISDRQRRSGLSVKDFCSNEGYSLSNFHYWKSKFGLTRQANRGVEFSEALAPVRFPSQVNNQSSSDRTNVSSEEIIISFSGEIQVHFRGELQTESAMKLITQIYTSHV
ncbi:MAG: IS66 family insertion sequence element accessory protein TnpB [Dysgonamonadaceae bacterium]|jgi:putative transposase|nr:IS66 family insertion sequence element accessory protein TnpB [Dysgonamonadaceae bacterium]